jgi:hypothetical protein
LEVHVLVHSHVLHDEFFIEATQDPIENDNQLEKLCLAAASSSADRNSPLPLSSDNDNGIPQESQSTLQNKLIEIADNQLVLLERQQKILDNFANQIASRSKLKTSCSFKIYFFLNHFYFPDAAQLNLPSSEEMATLSVETFEKESEGAFRCRLIELTERQLVLLARRNETFNLIAHRVACAFPFRLGFVKAVYGFLKLF